MANIYTQDELAQQEKVMNEGRFLKDGIARKVIITGKDGEVRTSSAGKEYTVPHFHLRDADTGETYTLKDFGWGLDNALKSSGIAKTLTDSTILSVTCTYVPDGNYEKKTYEVEVVGQDEKKEDASEAF